MPVKYKTIELTAGRSGLELTALVYYKWEPEEPGVTINGTYCPRIPAVVEPLCVDVIAANTWDGRVVDLTAAKPHRRGWRTAAGRWILDHVTNSEDWPEDWAENIS